MKIKLFLLLFIVFKFVLAQLDNVHHLQPLMAPNLTSGIAYEYIYLSTPSQDTITVKITYPDEITSPIITYYDGTKNTTVTNGKVIVSNAAPVRIRFTDINGNIIEPTNTPTAMSILNAGKVISANAGGLKFTSNKEFYVNYRGNSTNQAGSMLSKGRVSYGRHFFWGGIPPQKNPENHTINQILSITSVNDSTDIKIFGYTPTLKFLKESSTTTFQPNEINVRLNKGESYVLVAPINDTEVQRLGWLGSEITSTNDIIVTVGSIYMQGVDQQNRDIAFDQLVPTDRLGKEYLIMQGNGRKSYEKVVVVSTKPNTKIYVNGSTEPIDSLINPGEYKILEGSTYFKPPSGQTDYYGSMHIITNEDVYVFHKVFGRDVKTTPNVMFIPPLGCNGQNSIDLIPSARLIGGTEYTSSVLSVLARIGDAFTPIVTSNGVTVPILRRDPIPSNPNWEIYRYNVGSETYGGNLKIYSPGTIQAQILGGNGDAGFGGYFSGFGEAPKMNVVVDFKRFENVCTGDTGSSLLKPLNSIASGSVEWYKNDSLIVGANSVTYKIPETDTEPAIYKMILTLPDGCSYYSETIQTIKCPCSKEPNKAPGVLYPGIVGVSTTENTNANWPNNVNNAFLTLKSNDKGLVITRNADPETTITEPVEGMIVFDTDDNCYKLFDGIIWKCLRKKCYDYDN